MLGELGFFNTESNMDSITEHKLVNSILSGILFVVFSHPTTYSIMNRLFSSLFVFAHGSCPTVLGILAHSLLYTGTVFGLMYV